VTLLLPQTERVRVPELPSSTLEQWNDTMERFLQS